MRACCINLKPNLVLCASLATVRTRTYLTPTRGIIVVNLSKMSEGAQGFEGGHRHPLTLLSVLPLLVINAILFPGQLNYTSSTPMDAVSMLLTTPPPSNQPLSRTTSPPGNVSNVDVTSTSPPGNGKQQPTT